MNEERIFSLMMNALDGVLDEEESAELELGLADHPTLAQEWEAMQAIDNLLIATPAAAQPINFAANTLNRLPRERTRRLYMSIFFMLLLIGGLMPLIAGIVINSQLDLIGGSFAESVQLMLTVSTTLLSALFTYVSNQPMTWVVLSAMVGAILMWTNVFQNYSNRVQPVLIRS